MRQIWRFALTLEAEIARQDLHRLESLAATARLNRNVRFCLRKLPQRPLTGAANLRPTFGRTLVRAAVLHITVDYQPFAGRHTEIRD